MVRRITIICFLLLITIPLKGAASAHAFNREGDNRSGNVSKTHVFRDKQYTYNNRYAFRIYNNTLQARELNSHQGWTVIPLHRKQKTIVEISTDDRGIITVDKNRHLFYSTNALEDLKDFQWNERWGFPFGFGPKMVLPKDVIAWDISVVSAEKDKYYLAPNGNRYRLGKGCTSVFILHHQGKRITYMDPWLPSDHSYRVGLPERGRFVAQKLSASGSALFLIDPYGDMYTRDFDFDRSGADGLFFNYSYESVPFLEAYAGEIVPESVPMQLPLPGWKKQPGIDGFITDRITIVKRGEGLVYKELYVEGKKDGRIGYFYKDVSDEKWDFVHVPGVALQGNVLTNTGKGRSQEPLGSLTGITYQRENHPLYVLGIDNFKRLDYRIYKFDPYSSPNGLWITFDTKDKLRLILHTSEAIRIFRRDAGISGKPLKFRANIEIPEKIFSNRDQQPPAVQEYIKKVLKGRKYTKAKLSVSSKKLKMYFGTFRITLYPENTR